MTFSLSLTLQHAPVDTVAIFRRILRRSRFIGVLSANGALLFKGVHMAPTHPHLTINSNYDLMAEREY